MEGQNIGGLGQQRVWCTEGATRQEAPLTVRAAPKALTCVFMPHLSAIGPKLEQRG
jgi:hypothetical protein